MSTTPIAVIQAFDDACNANDIERAILFFELKTEATVHDGKITSFIIIQPPETIRRFQEAQS